MQDGSIVGNVLLFILTFKAKIPEGVKIGVLQGA